MYYISAPEDIKALVSAIANEHHDRLSGHEIAVVMQERARKRGGQVVLATASLPTPCLRPLLAKSVSFVICLGADAWEELDEAQREACIDHELCHCDVDGETGKPRILGHDYEEFACIVRRHGAWRRDEGEVAIQQALGLPKDPVRVSSLEEQ